MVVAFMVMLMAGHTANAQSLNTQAASLIYQIDTTIDYPSKYPLRPLTHNQIYNTSDAQLRRNEIQFIQNVIDTLQTVGAANIYNSNGQLNGNRKFGLQGDSLSFNKIGVFSGNDNSGNPMFSIAQNNIYYYANYAQFGTAVGNYAFAHFAGGAKTGGYQNGTGNSLAFNSGTGVDFATMSFNNSNVTKWDSITMGMQVTHLGGLTGAPGISAGAGAGTSPTVSISGDDLGGNFTITTGMSPAAANSIVTITFNTPYSSAPKSIIIQPADSIANAGAATSRVYIPQATISTTGFTLVGGSAALFASVTYQYYYFVKQ